MGAVNKRGVGIDKVTLSFLIIALVVVIFYFTVLNREVAEAGSRSASVTACKSSVDSNSRLHFGAIEFPGHLNCPARSIEITRSLTEKQQEDAKKMIATEMYDCWYQYGEGRRNLFKGEGTFCSVCSFIDVTAKEPVEGLFTYLADEPIPGNSGKSYYDYLAGFQTPQAKDILGDVAAKSPDIIDVGARSGLKGKSDYAVLFVYVKGKDQLEKVIRHLSSQTIAGEAGLVIGVSTGVVVGTGAAVGTATALTMLGVGVAGGPVGWIAVGAFGAGFASSLVASEITSFILSHDNVPEWAAFTVIREWKGAETAKMLIEEIGCTEFPVRLE